MCVAYRTYTTSKVLGSALLLLFRLFLSANVEVIKVCLTKIAMKENGNVTLVI